MRICEYILFNEVILCKSAFWFIKITSDQFSLQASDRLSGCGCWCFLAFIWCERTLRLITLSQLWARPIEGRLIVGTNWRFTSVISYNLKRSIKLNQIYCWCRVWPALHDEALPERDQEWVLIGHRDSPISFAQDVLSLTTAPEMICVSVWNIQNKEGLANCWLTASLALILWLANSSLSLIMAVGEYCNLLTSRGLTLGFFNFCWKIELGNRAI